MPSPGFLADFVVIPIEIGQFAEGMASDDLLENIRLIGIGAGHVVPMTLKRLNAVANLPNDTLHIASPVCGLGTPSGHGKPSGQFLTSQAIPCS